MANSIVRLTVESSEYENKVRRASKVLQDLADTARSSGQSFTQADKSAVDFAASLGKMNTASTTAKGKVKELTDAYTELSVRYKELTDEEKKSPYGQALGKSLDELKGRIQENKGRLDEVRQSLSETGSQGESTGGVLEKLAGKFGLNITQLGVMGTALGATSAALKVAKDAFFASEANVDAWGRTVEAGKSVYEGFLFALNTGDFSGFINNINSIINAAQKAYDALDRLGTMQRILAPSMSGQSKETQRLRQMLQTGTYIAPEDGRAPTPGLKHGQRLTPEQLKRVERQLGGSIQKEVGYQRQLIGQTNESIDAVYEQFATQMGITVQEFRKGTSSMEEFERRVKGGKDYTRWNLTNSPANSYYVSGASNSKRGKNPFAEFKGWDVFRVDGEPYGKLVELIQQRDQQIGSIYALETQGQRAVNRVEGYRPTANVGGGGGRAGGGGRTGGGGRGGSTHEETAAEKAVKMEKAARENHAKSINLATMRFEAGMDNSEQLMRSQMQAQERLTMALAEVYTIFDSESNKNAFENAAIEYNKLADVVKGKREEFENATSSLMGMSVNPSNVDSLLSESMEDFAKRKDINIDTSKMTKGAKEVKEGWQDAARAVQSVGAALQQIENPSAKIAGLIGEAIANIALGFAQATASDSKLGVFGWIAAIAGGLGTMISTISAIKSATAGSYAEGGIIPGNNYNDGLVANVSSGELILNRAQQNSIASQLSNNGIGNLQLEAVIDGEDIRLAVRNANRRRGRGEYVTSKTR